MRYINATRQAAIEKLSESRSMRVRTSNQDMTLTAPRPDRRSSDLIPPSRTQSCRRTAQTSSTPGVKRKTLRNPHNYRPTPGQLEGAKQCHP